MLGKLSRPSVRRLPENIIPGDRTYFPDTNPSPTSPLESKFRLPNSWISQDLGCVGLAIVAALDKTTNYADNNRVRTKFIVGSLDLNRSDPIPIGKNACKLRPVDDEFQFSDGYTYVTSHVSNKTTLTRVYCEGGGVGREYVGRDFDRKLTNFGMFLASPPKFAEETPAASRSDFLSSCYLCRKKLQGKDIYMYRGEKAFCSTECRNQQILSDERIEKCGSEASKSLDSSLYSESILFSPGVVVA